MTNQSNSSAVMSPAAMKKMLNKAVERELAASNAGVPDKDKARHEQVMLNWVAEQVVTNKQTLYSLSERDLAQALHFLEDDQARKDAVRQVPIPRSYREAEEVVKSAIAEKPYVQPKTEYMEGVKRAEKLSLAVSEILPTASGVTNPALTVSDQRIESLIKVASKVGDKCQARYRGLRSPRDDMQLKEEIGGVIAQLKQNPLLKIQAHKAWMEAGCPSAEIAIESNAWTSRYASEIPSSRSLNT